MKLNRGPYIKRDPVPEELSVPILSQKKLGCLCLTLGLVLRSMSCGRGIVGMSPLLLEAATRITKIFARREDSDGTK
jgi:hypothetical protein